MEFLASEQVREWDRRAIAECGVSGLALMNRAGAAVARMVAQLAQIRGGPAYPVLFVAGRGNNGGDAFVAARRLHLDGWRVRVRMICSPEELRGDARLACEEMRRAGVGATILPQPEAWQVWDETDLPQGGVVVDGLLGIGSTGAPRGVVAAAIQWIQRAARRAAVVAIDLPSGLDADTGEAQAPAVRADLTVSLAAPKAGFAHPCAWEYLGHLEVAEIGLPRAVRPAGTVCPGVHYNDAPALALLRPRRGRATHKGNYGHLLVIGGSHGLSGAPALAAMGALRGGTGLVSAAVPADGMAALAALAPSAMAYRVRDEAGGLTPATLAEAVWDFSPFDVVLAGPGLSRREGTRGIVHDLLKSVVPRLVLDADALNVLNGDCSLLRRAPGLPPVVITPHPGEAARLLGCTVAGVQGDRVAAAQELARRSRAVVVLKGAGTLVAGPENAPCLNLTGNPGLAKGGTGDVLAGLLAGLWAQGLSPLDAARLAVYWHGTAGDLAAWQQGEDALIAEDLGAFLAPASLWLTRVAGGTEERW
jgi:NAD(P)H-hydrate epimerase